MILPVLTFETHEHVLPVYKFSFEHSKLNVQSLSQVVQYNKTCKESVIIHPLKDRSNTVNYSNRTVMLFFIKLNESSYTNAMGTLLYHHLYCTVLLIQQT